MIVLLNAHAVSCYRPNFTYIYTLIKITDFTIILMYMRTEKTMHCSNLQPLASPIKDE